MGYIGDTDAKKKNSYCQSISLSQGWKRENAEGQNVFICFVKLRYSSSYIVYYYVDGIKHNVVQSTYKRKKRWYMKNSKTQCRYYRTSELDSNISCGRRLIIRVLAAANSLPDHSLRYRFSRPVSRDKGVNRRKPFKGPKANTRGELLRWR